MPSESLNPSSEQPLEEPVNLYLATEPGKAIKLETVARSSLEFVAALREAAYIVDPSLNLVVEIVSGTPASLSLNSILKSLGIADKHQRLSLIAIAATAALWLTAETASWGFQQILSHFTPLFEQHHLSEADREDIAKKIAQILGNQAPGTHIRGMFQVLDEDPNVAGLGVSQTHGARPTTVVPRSEFRARSSAPAPSVENRPDRVITERETVVLISPVLIEDTKRKWKFRGKYGEFSADIKDRSFLDSITHGRIAIRMVSNITFDVDLQSKWTYIEGVWTVERSVLRVHGYQLPGMQLDLRLGPP